MSERNYDTLISKLDEFIRKFYKNQLIRGTLYATGILVSGFLLLAVSEYFGHFNTVVRSVFFWGFLSAAIAVLGKFVAVPLFKWNKIGKIISHEQAATIIGQHFANVQDKLLNVLQLKNSSAYSGISSALIEASINQKIKELKPVPFTSAIDLRQNRKYAKYAAIPLLLILLIFFTNAGILTESTKRIIHPGEYFETQAPFRFEVNGGKAMSVVENEDFSLAVKMLGDEIPESVSILIDGNEYKLNRDNTINFSYIFRNVQKPVKFELFADGYTSKDYTLDVLPNPIVLNFDVDLHYPKYTGKKDETLKNTGDLVVPAGTNITWKFNTRATKNFSIRFSDSLYNIAASGDNSFSFSKKFLESKNYSLHTANEFLKSKDSIRYSINVIPDVYPAISVDEKKDSISSLRKYFTGDVKDDYGFTKLAFTYRPLNKVDSLGNPIPQKTVLTDIPVSKTLVRDQFYYYWDLSKLDVAPGEQIEYYFEVWDNDGVHGPKSTRSQRMLFSAPTQQQLAQQNDDNNKQIEQKLQETVDASKTLQKDLDDMYKKMMEKKSLDWQDKKKIEDLKNRQQALQKQVDDIKQQNAANLQQQQDFQKNDPDFAQKQDELQKLFDQLATDDMKKMMQELEQLLQNANKDQVQQELDKMKQQNKDDEKNLDRTLNLFREMELQQKMDQAIKDLDNMQQQQDSLSKMADQKLSKQQQSDLKNAQDSLNKRFDQFRQNMDKIEDLNNKLDDPHNIPNTDVQEMQIQQQQRNSSDDMSQGANKKASANMKNASNQMQQLSQQLQQAQNDMQAEQQAEDMQALRQLLDNLIQLSFDQEALMNKVKNTSINDPQYTDLARQQNKLRNDSKLIEDSLLALSKRNPDISPVINNSISKVNANMDQAIQALSDRNTGEAQNRDQLAMTSINDLALMLNEALESMMQQMNQQNKQQGQCKGGKCKKPGNGSCSKPGISSLRQMQQQLNGQIQKLQQGNGSASAEQLAKLAAQQEYIRQMLQQAMQDQQKNGGPNPAGQLQSKMDETVTDLVNKRITDQLVKRQQDILDKLLQFEKADQQRDMDNQRQAQQAKNEQGSNPTGFFEYNRQKLNEAELLKTVPPTLTPFYRKKVNTYFNGVQQK